MTPAEIMFLGKIRLVFDKLIPNKEKAEHTVEKTGNKFYHVDEKVFYWIYQMRKRYWDVETVVKRISRRIYLIKGPKMVTKGTWIKQKVGI